MSSIDKALGAIPAAAAVQARRLEIVAGNIANASTPNYKARDLDFRQVMSAITQPDAAPVGTPARAEQLQVLTSKALKYRVPLSASRDENTVESSVEEASYGDAATRYLAALRFAESTLSGLRKAYRGD